MVTQNIKSLPLTESVDILLADIAIRIQLSPTNYAKAVSRYETINEHIEREGSPLHDRVQLFYPQGSMAINATIASRLTTDHHDIDIVAQLDLPENSTPRAPLDMLYKAIKGDPSSRYYDCTKRQTRCVTVLYADGMHIDITPAIRRVAYPERESAIFNHRPEEPGNPGFHVITNPYGFAQWVLQTLPRSVEFAEAYAELSRSYDQLIFAEAQQDPVPDQANLYQKPLDVIVLQLIKRHRNIRYDRRQGRRPPSIMLTKLVVDGSTPNSSLIDELHRQAIFIRQLFQNAHINNQLLFVCNPICTKDVLTDRWPANLQDQHLFIQDLDHFVEQLERLRLGCPLNEMQKIMSDLFGERPATDAISSYSEKMGRNIRQGTSSFVPGPGRITPAPAAGIVLATAPSVARPIPKHTFHGE
jgi:hypothetical protein